MSVITIARRYAEALADVVTERNQVDKIDAEIRVFAEMMRSSRELHDTFANPIVSKSEKLRVLEALIARAHPDQITANLLRTMLSNDRVHYIPEVYEEFRRELNERKSLIVAEVTAATEVGRAEQENLARKLEQMTGKRVEFKFKTDPSLIGGVVTRIGSVVYDGSVRTQLQEFREQLKKGDRAT
jgi:F-type H+-transporting ATPase subunit delta